LEEIIYAIELSEGLLKTLSLQTATRFLNELDTLIVSHFEASSSL